MTGGRVLIMPAYVAVTLVPVIMLLIAGALLTAGGERFIYENKPFDLAFQLWWFL